MCDLGWGGDVARRETPCHTHLPASDVLCQGPYKAPGGALGPMHFPQDEAKVLALLEELLAGSPTPGLAQLQVDPQQKEKVTRVQRDGDIRPHPEPSLHLPLKPHPEKQGKELLVTLQTRPTSSPCKADCCFVCVSSAARWRCKWEALSEVVFT